MLEERMNKTELGCTSKSCCEELTNHTYYSLCFWQRALAKASAEQRSKVAMDNAADEETQERLAQAEASMEKQLTRVDKERVEVEKAVADLQKAKEDLDVEMQKSGNILKPASLAGVLLFSVRAALDAVAMMGGGIDSEAHMTAALIQGGIALVCAAYFLFF